MLALTTDATSSKKKSYTYFLHSLYFYVKSVAIFWLLFMGNTENTDRNTITCGKKVVDLPSFF